VVFACTAVLVDSTPPRHVHHEEHRADIRIYDRHTARICLATPTVPEAGRIATESCPGPTQ
jgi:hypothetical protein